MALNSVQLIPRRLRVLPSLITRTSSLMAADSPPGPVANSIHEKLSEKFSPTHLDIINESYMHNVPKGSETHFKVVIVSEKFANTKLIARHRMVNESLSLELQSGVHALSIVAKTPEQWTEGQRVDKSPACRGGFGK